MSTDCDFSFDKWTRQLALFSNAWDRQEMGKVATVASSRWPRTTGHSAVGMIIRAMRANAMKMQTMATRLGWKPRAGVLSELLRGGRSNNGVHAFPSGAVPSSLSIRSGLHDDWRAGAALAMYHKAIWTSARSNASPDDKERADSSGGPAAAIDKLTDATTTAAPHAKDDPRHVWRNPVPHPVYDLNEIAKSIQQTHHQPTQLHERVALSAVKVLRSGFDFASRYRGPGGEMTERDWLNRCLFLESIAGVPGMVAGMVRHLHSIRAMRRDYGWIHTLLEEAENERMHLLIFMNMKQPGWKLRAAVLGAQGVFFNAFFLTYLVSPRTCHRFVGYLEEEAVKTYTGLLKDIDDGHLKQWEHQVAPLIARKYYELPEDAKIADMIACIRADEANHRDVNHTFAGLDQRTGVNPFIRYKNNERTNP